MSILEKYVTGALGLIALYLLFNGQNTNAVLGTLSTANVSAIKALQGR